MARILVIDDDALVRLTIRGHLESQGHVVTEAEDGATGIRAAAAVKPHLILTDILMPNEDGIEFIRQLRRGDLETKIIAMSGGGKIDTNQLLDIAKWLGADDCLSKPFSKGGLLGSVNACLAHVPGAWEASARG